MKAKVKRVKKMGKDRPNRKLRNKGAVPFSALESAIVESDSAMETSNLLGTKRAPVKAETIGPRVTRKPKKVKVSPIGEKVLREIEMFPPEEEPVAGNWKNSNLKLTGIVGENPDKITRVIRSEKDLRISLNQIPA